MKNKTTAHAFEFTIEKIETLSIRRTRKTEAVVWCSECGDSARMLTPDDAAPVTGLSTRQIYSQIEAGRAHFAELAGGVLMVCRRSLM